MEMCKSVFCRCFNGRGSSGDYVSMNDQPLVVLDTNRMGQDVVIVKNGLRLCGTGAAVANVPIVQDKAYFEMKLQQSGIWGVGLATPKVDLNHVPLGRDVESWVLSSDGVVMHNGEVVHKLSSVLMEGDVIGLSYDHVELNFYLNGKNLECPVTSTRGELYPVLYVDDGAIVDAAFSLFYHTPPLGHERILIEKSLL